MFISVIALIVFLPVAVLPPALKTGFNSEELIDMGVCLENIQSIEPLPETPREKVKTSNAGHSCLFHSLSA
jgi:hypothetical protein